MPQLRVQANLDLKLYSPCSTGKYQVWTLIILRIYFCQYRRMDSWKLITRQKMNSNEAFFWPGVSWLDFPTTEKNFPFDKLHNRLPTKENLNKFTLFRFSEILREFIKSYLRWWFSIIMQMWNLKPSLWHFYPLWVHWVYQLIISLTEGHKIAWWAGQV